MSNDSHLILKFVAVFILLVVVFLFITHYNYEREKKIGDALLNNITLSESYEQLEGSDTLANISIILNGTDINSEVSIKTIFEIVSFDNTRREILNIYREESFDSIQFPYVMKENEVDTAVWYPLYKNNFKICTKVELVYKTNLWGLFDEPKRLEKCGTFFGTTKN